MSRVLVTGGAGFIGSHVVDRLLAAGHEPRIFDLGPSRWHPDLDAVLGDVRDLEALRHAMAGCDVVAHLAAAADVGQVASDPVAAEDLNARGTSNVLQAARETGVARVLYASTIWVYSDVDAERVDEDTPLAAPAHLYTATKLAGELYCRSYAELYGVQYTILRFGIPYGPRARPAAVVPAFVGKALAGEPLTIAGDGSQARRFVYVEDLAEGVVRAMAPGAANRIYNLVGDEDVSVREIAGAVSAAVGDTEIVHVEARAGDFKGVEVCGRRAAAELGWCPAVTFADGVARYVEWVRAHGQPAPAPALATPVAAVTPAPDPPPLPAAPPPRPRRPARVAPARVAALVLVGVVAGALAAAMTHAELFSDPASLIGTLVLLGLPTALVARIDWTRDRRDAAVVVAAMVGGALLALVWNWAGAVIDLAHDHIRATAVLAALAGLAPLATRRRRRAARA